MSSGLISREAKIPFSATNEWDLIRVIALQLSSRDPRVSIKELIDNAFDAFSRMEHLPPDGKQVRIIIRKKERANPHIKVFDNGAGWAPHKDVTDPRKDMPDFEYTVEHIGDSIKKKFAEFQKASAEGRSTGQFGLGLFSFWALGERLTIHSRSALGNGRIGPCSMMVWQKDVKDATIKHGVDPPQELSKRAGTVAVIEQLQKTQMNLITGNILKTYISRACRPILMKTGVNLLIDDHGSKFTVEPKKYEGTKFPTKSYETKNGFGSLSMEIYAFPAVDSPDEYQVPIFCKGAKVYSDITEIPELNIFPWNAKKVYGEINYPFGTIAPSRTAFVPDGFMAAFIDAIKDVSKGLSEFVNKLEAAKKARQRSKFNQIFRETWQEIFKNLPDDWKRTGIGPIKPHPLPPVEIGPMYRVDISPEGSKVAFRTVESFTARPFDMNGNIIRDPSLIYYWKLEGKVLGKLADDMKRTCHFQAGAAEGITTLSVTVFQYIKEGDEERPIKKTAATNFWIVRELPPRSPPPPPSGDRPPTFEEKGMGEDGPRSDYNPDLKIVWINNQHKDYAKANEHGEETFYRYFNYCYSKEVAVDRWKTVDPHELSEKIVELVAISERVFDWKELLKKPKGRHPKEQENFKISNF